MTFWTRISLIVVFYSESREAVRTIQNSRFFFVLIERTVFKMSSYSLVIFEPTITEVAFFHI
jgi:hypothetical protein